MKNLNGGYSMIDLTSTTLLVDLANAYALGKPVLAYDSNGKGNFYVLKENSGAYTLVGAYTTYNVTSEGVVTSATTSSKMYLHTITFKISVTLSDGTTSETKNVNVTLYKQNNVEKAFTRTNFLGDKVKICTPTFSISGGFVIDNVAYQLSGTMKATSGVACAFDIIGISTSNIIGAHFTKQATATDIVDFADSVEAL